MSNSLKELLGIRHVGAIGGEDVGEILSAPVRIAPGPWQRRRHRGEEVVERQRH